MIFLRVRSFTLGTRQVNLIMLGPVQAGNLPGQVGVGFDKYLFRHLSI
jgi:hypothetical protein